MTRKRAQEIVAKHAPSGTATKPELLYQLRSALKGLSGDLERLLATAPRDELSQLADDLLVFAMKLRSACRTQEKPPVDRRRKPRRWRRRQPAVA